MGVAVWKLIDGAPSTSIKLIFDRPYAFRPLSGIHSGDECHRLTQINPDKMKQKMKKMEKNAEEKRRQ